MGVSDVRFWAASWCLRGFAPGTFRAAGSEGKAGFMHGTRVWESVERRQLRRRGPRMERRQPGQRPDEAQPAGTDLLPPIKHIVVLMMENHSFDNYLGTLGRGEGLPAGADGQPDAENPDSQGRPVRAYHLPGTEQHDGVPCQSWSATHAQWADGKMTGFVTATPELT